MFSLFRRLCLLCWASPLALSLYLSLIGYCAHISNVIRVAVRSCKTTVARFLEHLRTNVSQLIMLKLLAVTDIP